MTYATLSPAHENSFYVGAFEEGQRHGTGEYFEATAGSTYQGDWEADLPNGFGRIEWHDGRRFSGKVANGRLEKGSFTYPTGSQFDGEFEEATGNFSGKGSFAD